jgi:hypothetical protein
MATGPLREIPNPLFCSALPRDLAPCGTHGGTLPYPLESQRPPGGTALRRSGEIDRWYARGLSDGSLANGSLGYLR